MRTMTIDQATVEQALEALRSSTDFRSGSAIQVEAVENLCEAMEQPTIKESLTAAQPEPGPKITHEQHIALREAFAIGSADSYFEAYPTHDNDAGRMLYERGFSRGFDSYKRAAEFAHGIKERI